ncbi:uncharacterized protein MONBRDRAFT_25535 [Monosiga brevicollis MX1]|uniref:Protein kinase domain-containing protein n=1 Tax=Monosiga brevicollis TaxID=81824 RepID=A9UZP8_MONBE|nr:uncharacterized protein MONBRDRAFT_25535 [Monosiga brevicollis MX1]EDQ89270.1 predicted protein [Monosiga brevicollis MX1]|eukprot:XP_001745846.1 hypothetical protein [Monosiga brevicollis MX1]
MESGELASGRPLVQLLTMQPTELGFVEVQAIIHDSNGQPVTYFSFSFLGQGNHCKAYKGYFDGEEAAFKIFNEEAAEDMENECDVLHQLQAAQARSRDQTTPSCCIVTSVGKKFETRPKACELQLLLGVLKAAHKAGFVHRDPLPRNYLRVPGGTVLFNDWGSAENIRKGNPVMPVGWPAEQAEEMIPQTAVDCSACIVCGRLCSNHRQQPVVPQFRHDLEMFAKSIFLKLVYIASKAEQSFGIWSDHPDALAWQPVLAAARELPDFQAHQHDPEIFVEGYEAIYKKFEETLLQHYKS